MSRILVDHCGETFKVKEWIMTKGFWEYFVLDWPAECGGDVFFAVVMGLETEVGGVSEREISPHVLMRSQDLDELAPPPGFKWAE